MVWRKPGLTLLSLSLLYRQIGTFLMIHMLETIRIAIGIINFTINPYPVMYPTMYAFSPQTNSSFIAEITLPFSLICHAKTQNKGRLNGIARATITPKIMKAVL